MDTDYGVGALTSATNALAAAASVSEQKKANQQNYEIALKNLGLSTEQMQYMRSLQERIFERDDNSISRMVKDLENNGFNKLLALGTGGLSNTTVSQPSAPQLEYRYHPVDYTSLKQNLIGTVVDIENLKNIRTQRSLMQTQAYGQSLSNILTQLKAEENAYNLEYYRSKGLPTNASGLPKVGGEFEGMINSKVNNLIEKAEKKVESMKEEQKKKSIERQKHYSKGQFVIDKFKNFFNKEKIENHSSGNF